MKTDEMVKLSLATGGISFAVGTYLQTGESRVVGDKEVTEHSVLLGQGQTVRVSVFTPKGTAPKVGGEPPVMKFGERVILVDLRVGVNKGYLNCSCRAIEGLVK